MVMTIGTPAAGEDAATAVTCRLTRGAERGRHQAGELRLVAACEGPRSRRPSPRSVAFEVHVLRMAWRWGREVGVVPAHELPRVSVRVQGHIRDRYRPTPTEVARVMRELEGWAQLALLLYAGTGCRLDEIAALRWADVDLDGGAAHGDGQDW